MLETPSDLYLTPIEMKVLTGSPVFRCQERALKKMGWAYFVDSHGRVKVLRKYHDAKMAGEQVDKKPKNEPNWTKAA